MDPAKPPTKPLAQEISWNLGSRINKIRCALLTALDIAEALKFMHKSTTLHGDLKPHNILLVTDMKVRRPQLFLCVLFTSHQNLQQLCVLSVANWGLFSMVLHCWVCCWGWEEGVRPDCELRHPTEFVGKGMLYHVFHAAICAGYAEVG